NDITIRAGPEENRTLATAFQSRPVNEVHAAVFAMNLRHPLRRGADLHRRMKPDVSVAPCCAFSRRNFQEAGIFPLCDQVAKVGRIRDTRAKLILAVIVGVLINPPTATRAMRERAPVV